MNNKIKKELDKFRKFKKKYDFKYKSLTKDEDGNLFLEGVLIKPFGGDTICEGETFINVGYNLNKNPLSKLLSNLYHYDFKFRGFKFKSIEGFFQGIKFVDKKLQKKVFKMFGMEAYCIKGSSSYNWKNNHVIFFQGRPIDRKSNEYENLVDELYISALQNPFFRGALKNVNKYIVHSIGSDNDDETVLTRFEFEKQLNCLKDFLKTSEK